METYRLNCHVDTPPRAVSAITVELGRRSDGGLDLRFLVHESRFVDLPPPAPPTRRDGLWQETCLEFFVRPEQGETYREFNLAPSGEWAAYAFDRYREGMRDLPLDAAPSIHVTSREDMFVLDAAVPPYALPEGAVLFGLNAVILEEGGVRSYWALAHAPDKPDFHHAACFAAALPAPEAS